MFNGYCATDVAGAERCRKLTSSRDGQDLLLACFIPSNAGPM
jgi:hypothetical protein